MFHRSDERQTFDETVAAVTWPVAQCATEYELHLIDERIDVDSMRPELLVHLCVGLRVHRFLPDEPDDVLAQGFVVDERERLLEGSDEPLLALGQKEVHDVHQVRSKWIAVHVVKWERSPIERDVSRMQQHSIVGAVDRVFRATH